MFIIVVGPDGAGKTTLVNKLARQTGFETMKWSKPNSDEEKIKMYEDYCQVVMHKNNIIFDRFMYCEQVYGSVMRDNICLTEEQVYYIETLLAIKGAIIIHCTDTVGKLWDRCKKRGEDYIDSPGLLWRIKDGYDQLFAKEKLIPVVTYTIRE